MAVRSQGFGRKGDRGESGTVGPQGVRGEPGAAGAAGIAGPTGAKGDTGAQGTAGAKGDPGTPGAALVGTVTLTQTAAIALALGIREVTATLAGTVKGQRYLAFCDSYRLNGAASVVGRPAGYAIVDCVCNADGQITVSVNAPLLAIGQSYALTCSIVKVNV